MIINELTIQPAKETDVDEIYEIEHENFKPGWSRDYLALNIKLFGKLCLFYVAKLKGSVVGYIVCWLSEETAHIHNISVKKEYQNHGVGSQLLMFLFDELKKRNVKNVVLEVRVSNIRAIKLYEKFGFVEIAKKEKFYPDGEDALFMVKDL